jgi:hypothetical protein
VKEAEGLLTEAAALATFGLVDVKLSVRAELIPAGIVTGVGSGDVDTVMRTSD